MKKGFTLSEVLITLVIIGVIAAITVPILHENYTEEEKKAKIKKGFSTLANAMTRVKADGGTMILDYDINDDLATVQNWFEDYLEKYLITTKVCYNTPGCWSDTGSKYMNGSSAGGTTGIGYPTITAVLNDGMFINIDRCTISSYGIDSPNQYGLIVYFDINGNKKPNVVGKDIFLTVFTDDGLVPAFKDRTRADVKANCSSGGNGRACIMNYLRQ